MFSCNLGDLYQGLQLQGSPVNVPCALTRSGVLYQCMLYQWQSLLRQRLKPPMRTTTQHGRVFKDPPEVDIGVDKDEWHGGRNAGYNIGSHSLGVSHPKGATIMPHLFLKGCFVGSSWVTDVQQMYSSHFCSCK